VILPLTETSAPQALGQLAKRLQSRPKPASKEILFHSTPPDMRISFFKLPKNWKTNPSIPDNQFPRRFTSFLFGTLFLEGAKKLQFILRFQGQAT